MKKLPKKAKISAARIVAREQAFQKAQRFKDDELQKCTTTICSEEMKYVLDVECIAQPGEIE